MNVVSIKNMALVHAEEDERDALSGVLPLIRLCNEIIVYHNKGR